MTETTQDNEVVCAGQNIAMVAMTGELVVSLDTSCAIVVWPWSGLGPSASTNYSAVQYREPRELRSSVTGNASSGAGGEDFECLIPTCHFSCTAGN